MLKISDNPPMLFPQDSTLESAEGRWWVAHTKARNEKALARALARNNVPYFMPLREKICVYKGRKYKSLLPLFSGYMFFCGGQEQRHVALLSNRIVQVIEVTDQAVLKGELKRIYQAVSSGLPINPHPFLTRGSSCRVVAGPLVGLEGIVVRRTNVCKLLLQVSMLGQAAAIEIATDLVEPIQN